MLNIPEHKLQTLRLIVSDLKNIDGVAALVLGGSYATGMAHANSDLDIGIYYHSETAFEIQKIRDLASGYHVGDALTVTDFYQWGNWVNGGAWITTLSGEVDLLYKNIDQISSVIEKVKEGLWDKDYEQQPPFGFSSLIFLAETHCCIPLSDPTGVISSLKREVERYPAKLKSAVVQQSLWSADFTLSQADKFALMQDMYACVGCLTRATKNIVDALFALNEVYPMGDKAALRILTHLDKCPSGLEERVEGILSLNKHVLKNSVSLLRSLFNETVAMAEGLYQPYFEL